MERTFSQFSRLAAIAASTALLALLGCDKNGQTGVLQHSPANPALQAEVTPDKAYDQMFEASTDELSDNTYLIITKAQKGSIFTVHTGPRPTADHAVCFASVKNPGFRECVEEYYHHAGAVAVQSDEAGWWATPL